jgi:hypothetical protein
VIVMKKLFLLGLLPVAACTVIGYGGELPFERQGVQTCTEAGVVEQGTANDPVRCGPQAQPVS